MVQGFTAFGFWSFRPLGLYGFADLHLRCKPEGFSEASKALREALKSIVQRFPLLLARHKGAASSGKRAVRVVAAGFGVTATSGSVAP